MDCSVKRRGCVISSLADKGRGKQGGWWEGSMWASLTPAALLPLHCHHHHHHQYVGKEDFVVSPCCISGPSTTTALAPMSALSQPPHPTPPLFSGRCQDFLGSDCQIGGPNVTTATTTSHIQPRESHVTIHMGRKVTMRQCFVLCVKYRA